MNWDGWPFERVALIFIGLAFGIITVQTYLFHKGGAFHRWQMWIPVLFGPILFLAGIVSGAILNKSIVAVSIILFSIGFLGGLGGTYYHLRAIGNYILGYRLRNFIDGPPPLLPPTFAALSAFGIIATYWARYMR
ncbi:MAG: hypothetical protein ACYC27_19355 [Armatimonadota bacterium]